MQNLFTGCAILTKQHAIFLILPIAVLVLGIIPHYPHYSPKHWPVAFPFPALISGIACADLVRDWKKLKATSLLLT
jgi:hypothetical protein